MVRAAHGGAPVHLTAPERSVFQEPLRLGADLADEMESKVMAYGRWLLEAVFKNAATEALDDKTDNPIWLELVRRSGGPTLRVGKRMLYVALRLAAYDKRITDQTWRGLDAGRKELFLPLHEDHRLRTAAQHVAKFNLTQTKTTAYVRELLTESGEPTRLRLTAPVLSGRMRKLCESIPSRFLRRGDARRPPNQAEEDEKRHRADGEQASWGATWGDRRVMANAQLRGSSLHDLRPSGLAREMLLGRDNAKLLSFAHLARSTPPCRRHRDRRDVHAWNACGRGGAGRRR